MSRRFSTPRAASLKQFVPAGLVHSAVTGKTLQSKNTLELMELVLEEVLRGTVRWDRLLEETVSQVAAGKPSQVKVHALGVTNVSNSLASALKAGGLSAVTVKDHNSWIEKPIETNGRTQNDKIAIVGMAGRFPDAASHEALWDLLMNGLDVHREIPKDRFDAKAHYDPTGKGKNKSHTMYGCFIEEPGLFDPRFFNMSPREAAQTDPMGRLALTTAYEALEMSGYVPNRTPSTKLDRIGTFYGQTSDDWREINAAENVDTYYITGGVRAFAPGRINYYFKFTGPSYSVDTACSSSMAAIQLACTSLWAGDVDTAVAGGLNVLTNPDIFSGLSKGQFLSKTGSCKTYDNDADGYCRGDGCASIILKRYEDAIADKDPILGCILGSGTNHSAEAVSITHPHAGNQEFLFKKVLAECGTDAHEVVYVEMHGTGTQAGDGIEMTSVTNAFAPPHRRRKADEPLYLGAIKANIGHAEAASGVNALIKLIMMMKEDVIPPNVGIKGVMNKTFPKDLGDRKVNIPVVATPLPARKGNKLRKFFLNNFSAAGGNTSALLEEGPIRVEPAGKDNRGHQIITVTSRAISSMKKNINNLITYLDKHPETTLPSLSYTTTARRIQHNYRVSFIASDMSQVKQLLQAQIKESYSPVAMVPATTAFAFTGQGSQYTGLGQSLYEDLPSFKADIDQLDNITRLQNLPSFLPLLTGADVLTLSPIVVQLGMACIQVALARMWATWGIKPVAVVGHSLGEYAALHVAGVLSANDMIRLVGRRAEQLVAKCTAYTHGMLAVRGGVEDIKAALGDKMTEIACKNGPAETVLCGPMELMNTTHESLNAKGFKATLLKVPFAFHSAQVEPIEESFKALASSVVYNKPMIPVLSPLTGEVIREAGIIGPEYLARHARECVDFWSALVSGQSEGVFNEKTTWLEVGAHPVCSGMVRSSVEGTPITAPSLRRGEDPWKTITSTICTLYNAGVYINFDEYHREFNDAHELLVLPTYSFDSKTYWLDYHNNWTLTKGEVNKSAPAVAAAAPAVIEAAPAKRLSTSCQRIVKEEFNGKTGTVVVQSNISEPKLLRALSGHEVNGAPLCPSSLFADMALTVADYLYKQLNPSGTAVGYNVCNMAVPKTFIAKVPQPAEGEHIQIEATADLEAGQAALTYRSVTPAGKTLIEHATCLVKFEDIKTWQEQWDMTSFMVKSQISNLERKLTTGDAHKVLRGMAYKLFKAFVNYDEKYRGMDDIIIDGKDTEAVSTVRFKADDRDGDFMCAPYWIDSLCHISGFICNGTDLIDSDENVYISHGWGSMRFAKAFSAKDTYRSYVRMLPQPGNVLAGDVYIMEGDNIVGICGGLKFQQIPRKVLNIFIPPVIKKGQAVAAPAAKAAPAPKAAAPVKAASKAAPAPKAAAPKKVKAPKVKKAASSGGIVDKVMKIIAAETEVDMAELVDDAAFDNLGVDSLLSLTIAAKFREDLELDIPADLFTTHATIGAMKKYFAQFDNGSSAPVEEESDSESDDDSDIATPAAFDEVSTPPSSAPSEADEEEKPAKAAAAPSGGVSLAREIIAREMGIEVEEITNDGDLTELGMDSLMSLTILGELREATGIDLPSTFLVTNGTMEQIEEALDMKPKAKAAAPKSKPSASKPAPAQLDAGAVSAKLRACQKDVSKCPPSTSVLLQGNAKTATKKLFLFPDGSGSATSYISIPNMGSDVAIYGMNCPFMKNPKDYLVGIDGVSTLYMNELKRRQPTGPYYIGGWSAGGVVAYEVACQLMARGDKVAKLILIDSPNPGMANQPLPARLHHFFDQIGLLGTGGTGSSPEWLLPHFEYSIKALKDYVPQPMPAGQAPSTFAIWAREGVCAKPSDPKPPPAEGEDPAPMKWLLNNRTDFTDNGWAGLLGKDAMKFASMDGNHFTMMRDEHVSLSYMISFLNHC